MPLEIERRFLVAGDGWRQHIRSQDSLRQGYLMADQKGTVLRVRISQAEFPSGKLARLGHGSLSRPHPRQVQRLFS